MALKVGVDIRSLADAEPTGVAVYTRNIIAALQQTAPDIELRLYASGSKQRSLHDLGVAEENGTTLTWNTKPNKILNARAAVLRGPMLDRQVGGADVWFSPNLNFTSLSAHVPHVQTVHDISYQLYPAFFSAKRRIWHAATKAGSQIEQATHLICDSHSTAQDLTKAYGIRPEHISVVWLGAELSVHPTQSESEQVRMKLELPSRYIAAVGSIEPRKNLTALVQALEDVAWSRPDLGLVLIGPYGWKSGPLQRAISRSVVADRIHVVGYVSAAQKRAVLAQAEALFCASSYEGFGLPVLEAMQLGVPVITSNVSSLPEVAQDAALLVDPERHDHIARALLELLTHEDLQDELRKKGRTRATQFTWSQAGQETAKVLRAVAEHGVGIVSQQTQTVEVL